MSKKGFTLVELLAVIIILSLLALLTSTAVTKLVKDAKDDLNSTQLELIKSAAQTWGADNLSGLPDVGKCSYLTLANLKDYGILNSNLKNLNTNEPIPDDLKIKISTSRNEKSGKLTTTYEVNPKNEDVEVCYQQVYNNGEAVYYDVVNGIRCTENDYKVDNSIAGYNGLESTKTTNNQNSCLKFYAFNDTLGNKLNLLLDHNTTVQVDWGQAGAPSKEIGFALDKLYNDTREWHENIVSPNNYYYKGNTISYTIDYNGYKARLITAQEIAIITGADKVLNWNETSSTDWYYLDGEKSTDQIWHTQVSNSTDKSEYYWLFDRTHLCTDYGCYNDDSSIQGYWTSTINNDNLYTWAINRDGSILANGANEIFGLRPVITILKYNS